jgi:hypothetical protein
MIEFIKTRLHKNAFKKSILLGGITPVSGMLLHTIKQRLLFPAESPPDAVFLISVSVLFFVTGFLFACGYFLFKPALPGRKNYTKALAYALAANIAVYFPQIIGMIGFDFTGSFNLLTAFKLEQYATAAADFANICTLGIILGLLDHSQDRAVTQGAQTENTRLPAAVLLCAVLFPLCCALLFFIGDSLLPRVFNIPQHARLWFYSGIFVPLCLTGGALPVFYGWAESVLSGKWSRKGMDFSVLFFLLFWLVCIVFVIPFGYSIWVVLMFTVVTFPPLVFVVLLSAKMLTKGASGAAAVYKRG